MSDTNYLKELVAIAGRGLEAEDRCIAGCVTINRQPDEPTGILRPPLARECYYQALIARSLIMSRYPYRVDLEKEQFDFVLSHPPARDQLFAVGEMKLWLSPEGKKELPEMRIDIKKLRARGLPSFLLVATAWEPGERRRHVRALSDEIELDYRQLVDPHYFRTIGWSAREVEFALLGYAVTPT